MPHGSVPKRCLRALEQSAAISHRRSGIAMMSMTPLKDRKQQVLTPAQQLEMREAIQKCKSLGEVIRVVDRYIFDRDHDSDVDAIEPALTHFRSIQS